jgi:hypothetical protein
MQLIKFPSLPDELLTSYPAFADRLWWQLGFPGLTEQQVAIADRMQHGPEQDIICGFRGVAKSWLAAGMLLWRLRIDPASERCLLVSGSSPKALELSQFMIYCIGVVKELQCLEPETGQRSSVLSFDVAGARPDQAPSVRATGILGQITGKRATIILADDIETPINSASAQNREKIWSVVGSEFNSVLKPADALMVFSPKILYLGTPQLPGASIYMRLRREFNIPIYFLPARYPKPEDVIRYEGGLAEHIAVHCQERAGQPTDPERFPEHDLQKREKRMSPQTWQLQFMLDTSLDAASRYPISLQDLIVMELPPNSYPSMVLPGKTEAARLDLPSYGFHHDRWYYAPSVVGGWKHFENENRPCLMAIDPAGRGKDELAWAVVGVNNGYFLLLDAGGTQAGPVEDTLSRIVRCAARWKVNEVVIEDNFGLGLLGELLKPLLRRSHPCAVTTGRSGGNVFKEKRIVDTLSPIIQQNRMVVRAGLVEEDYQESQSDPETGPLRSLFYQLAHILPERNSLEWDDRADALELACRRWVEQGHGAADAELILEQEEAEYRKELLKSWSDGNSLFNADRLTLGMTLEQARTAASFVGRWSRTEGDPGPHWIANRVAAKTKWRQL